jgi:hypothetical protein
VQITQHPAHSVRILPPSGLVSIYQYKLIVDVGQQRSQQLIGYHPQLGAVLPEQMQKHQPIEQTAGMISNGNKCPRGGQAPQFSRVITDRNLKLMQQLGYEGRALQMAALLIKILELPNVRKLMKQRLQQASGAPHRSTRK